MTIIGYSRARPATSGRLALAAAPLVTSSSYHGAGNPKSIRIGATEAGDDIFVLTCNSTGDAITVTTPANFDTLQEISVNNTQVKLHRWNGTGTRPDDTTVAFTANATAHFMAQSWIVRGGQTAAGVHAAVNGDSGNGPFAGPAGLPTAPNSLVQHIWVDGVTRAVLPPEAPTAGFGASGPGAYPAQAGLVSNTIRAPIHLHWGTHGTGAYVTPRLGVVSYAIAGCITVETRAAS
jgi:hypothetical protein